MATLSTLSLTCVSVATNLVETPAWRARIAAELEAGKTQAEAEAAAISAGLTAPVPVTSVQVSAEGIGSLLIKDSTGTYGPHQVGKELAVTISEP